METFKNRRPAFTMLRATVVWAVCIASLVASSGAYAAEDLESLAPPSCGDTIRITAVQHHYSNQTTSFRLVGVDMAQWVGGRNRQGTVNVWITDDVGVHGGTYNVTGQSGFNIGLTAANATLVSGNIIVEASVRNSAGTVRCQWIDSIPA